MKIVVLSLLLVTAICLTALPMEQVVQGGANKPVEPGVNQGPDVLSLAAVQGQDRAGQQPCAATGTTSKPNILFAIADDWSYPHAGVYGDKIVRTPTFDRLAREGVLFTNAFCATPSCTASRGAILTGQTPHRLAEGGNLWSSLHSRFEVYPDLLERAGYVVGCTGKGWGPGNFQDGGRSRNPAGPSFKSFGLFLKAVPKDRSFCYWFGSYDPHRPYKKGSGQAAGMKIEDVVVPHFLPDTPEIRGDILDYYFEVQRFDTEVGELLQQLAESGRADNTIVVMTSDNGMPFPRAKANLYDAGTHMPLAIRWPAGTKGGRLVDDFISFTDFAPTILEAAGLEVPSDMTGRSLFALLTGKTTSHRDRVFLERERHAQVRADNGSYPCRAVRTRKFLYIRNLRHERWPAGDPELEATMGCFGDIDTSPSKQLLLDRRSDPAIARFFSQACAKRPAEELYDIRADPDELNNVADKPEYAGEKSRLRAVLDAWMKETADPRAISNDDRWDHYPYYGRQHQKQPASQTSLPH